MHLRTPQLALVAAVLVAAPGLNASATTYSLNLTGIVSQGAIQEFDIGAFHVIKWALPLQGLAGPIEIAEGDTIEAAIALDHPIYIPMAARLSAVGFSLSSASFPQIDTTEVGAEAFYNGGALVRQGRQTSSGTRGALMLTNFWIWPSNPAFTFDSIVSTATVVELPEPVTVDHATLFYRLLSPIPEPASWGLMLLGFGATGARMRGSRRRDRVGVLE